MMEKALNQASLDVSQFWEVPLDFIVDQLFIFMQIRLEKLVMAPIRIHFTFL